MQSLTCYQILPMTIHLLPLFLVVSLVHQVEEEPLTIISSVFVCLIYSYDKYCVCNFNSLGTPMMLNLKN